MVKSRKMIADLRQHFDRADLGDEPEAVRTGDHAGKNETDDGGNLEAVAGERHRDREAEDDDDVFEKQVATEAF